MPEPLTMSAEQEREDRNNAGMVFGHYARALHAYAEIDALRARIAEFDAAVEQAASLIGSEYRDASVIVVALNWLGWQRRRVAELEAALSDARESNARLNRRAQEAEAKAARTEKIERRIAERDRGKPLPRIEAAFAIAAAEVDLDALRSEVGRLRAALYDVLEMCLDPNDANESFEQVGRLYERATGHLRPGKDDPLRDSSSDENRKRFHEWHDAEWAKRYAAARALAQHPEAPDA